MIYRWRRARAGSKGWDIPGFDRNGPVEALRDFGILRKNYGNRTFTEAEFQLLLNRRGMRCFYSNMPLQRATLAAGVKREPCALPSFERIIQNQNEYTVQNTVLVWQIFNFGSNIGCSYQILERLLGDNSLGSVPAMATADDDEAGE
jgi:hypothetical protein